MIFSQDMESKSRPLQMSLMLVFPWQVSTAGVAEGKETMQE